jgi:sigma-B regulation protein RsbU (phosphoserine phosphatase)
MKTTEHDFLREDPESFPPEDQELLHLPCILLASSLPLPGALESMIKEAGYHLEREPDGALVVSTIKARQPGLILMHTDLSGSDCYELCQRLQCDTDTDVIPIIFIRETHDSEALIQGLQRGAYDFFSLSSDPRELMARIESAFRFRQLLGQSDALAGQLREMNTELYERNLQVEKELYVTRQLQQSFLPKAIEEPATAQPGSGEMSGSGFSRCHYRNDRIRISGVYLPCDALGGDLYDIIQLGEDTVGVTIADVSGHGVPAAFVTAIFKAAFYRITLTHEKAGDVLFHMNNELYQIVKTGEYVTSLFLRLMDDGKLLEYSGAGHPYPILYHAKEKRLERLQENGTPLVWVKDMEYPTAQVPLQPGDRVLLFTDGISEIKNDRRELFGEEALEALFERLIEEHPDAILDKMIEVLSDFTQGHPLDDDMSLVLIEALPAGETT